MNPNNTDSEARNAAEGALEDAEQFDDLMSNYLDAMGELELGQVTRARVIDVKRDYVLLDVGDKAEGVVDLKEFQDYRGNLNVAVGDEVDVVIQSRDSESGQLRVSHRQAKQRANWDELLRAYEKGHTITGHVIKSLKNGLLVDAGVPCFLPASQIDVGKVDDLEKFVGKDVEAYVIDVDRARHRGVLSRRRLLSEERRKKRHDLLETMTEGATISGKVKNIQDFGVFVELGGIDGMVPREEIAWEKRVNIAEVLKVNTSYKFKIIAIDKERERVTLSRRQLKPDPWQKIEHDYPKELTVNGTITNLTNNCAYVVLDDAIEGRIHRSNLSWATSVRKPSDVLKKGDAVKAVVLDWDKEKRLLDLGLKQVSDDPWAEIGKRYAVNSRHKVKVLEVVPYGAFVQLDEATKGLIHISDMSWDKNFRDPKQLVKVGDELEAVVLKIDMEQRRINLGLKQLQEDPFKVWRKSHPQGSVITGKVKNVTNFGVFVELAPKIEGLLHISQWSREKVESLENEVKPGDEVTAKIIKIEPDIQKVSLSRKTYLAEQERKEIDQYRQNKTKETASTSLGNLLKDLKIDVNK